MEAKRDRSAWLKGPAFPCEELPPNVARPWRIVLLGAPRRRQGTQAELLTQQLGASIFQQATSFGTAKTTRKDERSPAMSDALEYMRRGDLVPDATVLQMLAESVNCLRCHAFLARRFPRTWPQAEALQALIQEQNLGARPPVLEFWEI